MLPGTENVFLPIP